MLSRTLKCNPYFNETKVESIRLHLLIYDDKILRLLTQFHIPTTWVWLAVSVLWRHSFTALWDPTIHEGGSATAGLISRQKEAGKMRTVQAQIKHMQIRSIFLKITQTTFFVICLMNGAYILLEVCWSLILGAPKSLTYKLETKFTAVCLQLLLSYTSSCLPFGSQWGEWGKNQVTHYS